PPVEQRSAAASGRSDPRGAPATACVSTGQATPGWGAQPLKLRENATRLCDPASGPLNQLDGLCQSGVASCAALKRLSSPRCSPQTTRSPASTGPATSCRGGGVEPTSAPTARSNARKGTISVLLRHPG